MTKWRAISALTIFVLALPRETYAAGGAYQVDTAEVSELGACKVESWASLASNRDIFAATSPACVVDLGRAVEISSQFSRARASDEWSSSATPKIKTNLIPTAIGSWGLAASAQGSYDLSTGYNTALFTTLPATLRLNDAARINLSGGWQWDRLLDRHYLTYGAGFDRVQVGLRWRPVEEFNIDLIYGRNLQGENAHWITLATTVRFSAGK